jgi:hypothetical protein
MTFSGASGQGASVLSSEPKLHGLPERGAAMQAGRLRGPSVGSSARTRPRPIQSRGRSAHSPRTSASSANGGDPSTPTTSASAPRRGHRRAERVAKIVKARRRLDLRRLDRPPVPTHQRPTAQRLARVDLAEHEPSAARLGGRDVGLPEASLPGPRPALSHQNAPNAAPRRPGEAASSHTPDGWKTNVNLAVAHGGKMCPRWTLDRP